MTVVKIQKRKIFKRRRDGQVAQNESGSRTINQAAGVQGLDPVALQDYAKKADVHIPSQKALLDVLSIENGYIKYDSNPLAVWNADCLGGIAAESYARTDIENIYDAKQTINNDLYVLGNIIQNGDHYITHAQHLNVENNIARLNQGEPGAQITGVIPDTSILFSGFEINRGTSDPYYLGVVEGEKPLIKLGKKNSLEAICAREDNIPNDFMVKWDANTNQIVKERLAGDYWHKDNLNKQDVDFECRALHTYGKHDIIYHSNLDSSLNNAQLHIKGLDQNRKLLIGFHSGSDNYGVLQALEDGVGFRTIRLNPQGGDVTINNEIAYHAGIANRIDVDWQARDFIAERNLVLKGHVISDDYISGATGRGIKIAKTDSELDSLFVRKELSVNVFKQNEIAVNNGSLIISQHATISDVIWRESGQYWSIYFDKEVSFESGDFVKCKLLGKYYLCRIQWISTNKKALTFKKSNLQGTGIPEIGDFIFKWKSDVAERNYMQYFTEQYSDLVFDGITVSRRGLLTGIQDEDFGGELEGVGDYIQNLYAKGGFYLKGGDLEGNASSLIKANKDGIVALIEGVEVIEDDIFNHETRITANAQGIQSKVSVTAFNSLTNQVGSNNTLISQNAEAIDLRATKNEMVAAIKVEADKITTLIQDVEVIEDDIQNHETRITANAQGLQSKVSVTAFNSLTNQVESNNTLISQNAEAIDLRATKNEMEAAVKVEADKITALVENVEVIEDDIQNHETRITANAQGLTSKVSTITYNGLVDTVETHSSKISQNSSAILLRATKEEMTSAIAVEAGKISLLSDRVELSENSLLTFQKGIFNMDFSQGNIEGWTPYNSGRFPNQDTRGIIKSGETGATGNVWEISGQAVSYYRNPIKVKNGCNYRFRFRVRQMVENGNRNVYFGFAPLDGEFNLIKSKITFKAQSINISDGWIEWEYLKSYEYLKNCRLEYSICEYIRPMLIVNYAGGEGTAQIDYLTVEEISEEMVTSISKNTIKTTDIYAENLKVKAANIQDKLTAQQIEVEKIQIVTAQITGTFEAETALVGMIVSKNYKLNSSVGTRIDLENGDIIIGGNDGILLSGEEKAILMADSSFKKLEIDMKSLGNASTLSGTSYLSKSISSCPTLTTETTVVKYLAGDYYTSSNVNYRNISNGRTYDFYHNFVLKATGLLNHPGHGIPTYDNDFGVSCTIKLSLYNGSTLVTQKTVMRSFYSSNESVGVSFSKRFNSISTITKIKVELKMENNCYGYNDVKVVLSDSKLSLTTASKATRLTPEGLLIAKDSNSYVKMSSISSNVIDGKGGFNWNGNFNLSQLECSGLINGIKWKKGTYYSNTDNNQYVTISGLTTVIGVFVQGADNKNIQAWACGGNKILVDRNNGLGNQSFTYIAFGW